VITTLPKWLRPSKWRGCVGLGERECPVDHSAQAMLRDGPVHCLEIGAASDVDRPDRNAPAGQQ
jgi:hypothetical protein